MSVGYTMCTIDRHSIYVYTQSIVKKSLIHESMNETRQSLEEQLDCWIDTPVCFRGHFKTASGSDK